MLCTKEKCRQPAKNKGVDVSKEDLDAMYARKVNFILQFP